MAIEVWEAALGAAAAGAGGFWSRRSKGEKDANSAKVLAEAYGLLVDDQRESIADARKHIHRQDEEIAGLRLELRSVREQRDQERDTRDADLKGLRDEIAALRTENAELREQLALLRPAPIT